MEGPRFGGHWPPPVMNPSKTMFSQSVNHNILQEVSEVLLDNAGSLLRAKHAQQELPPGLIQQEVEDALTELKALDFFTKYGGGKIKWSPTEMIQLQNASEDHVEEAGEVSNMVIDAVKDNFGKFASAVKIQQQLAPRG
eukprot:8943465-Pyramimonas_sp.AAC.1